MKNLLYNAIKITIAVSVAILIANILALQYATTAGVIAMLSILDSRKQTYIVGLKRIITGIIAVVLSSLIFMLIGHHLISIALFLLIFIPALTVTKNAEGLTVGTVLMTHIYAINRLGIDVAANEIGLLLIGVLMGFALNLHRPNLENDIKKIQSETEVVMAKILRQMGYLLLNQCPIDDQRNALEQLDRLLTEGLNKALIFNNNYILTDYSYYIRYFQMRRQQYLILLHMKNHFRGRIFIDTTKAKPIKAYTDMLAEEFNEDNDGTEALNKAEDLMDYYRKQPLPETREDFENRSTLFQYLTDLIYFVDIKYRFAKKIYNKKNLKV